MFFTKVISLWLLCSAAEVLASKHLKFDFVKRSADAARLEKRDLNDTLTQDVAKLVRRPPPLDQVALFLTCGLGILCERHSWHSTTKLRTQP